MTRRSLRRNVATVCTAVFAAGILGVAVSGPAGAESRGQIATPPPPGSGITITVIEEVEPLPIGPLSFT